MICRLPRNTHFTAWAIELLLYLTDTKIKCDILKYTFDDSLQWGMSICIYTNPCVHIYLKSSHIQNIIFTYIASQLPDTQYILSISAVISAFAFPSLGNIMRK